MRRVAVLCATFALSLLGCGYVDDNPKAARIVAQAYLDGYERREPAAICRVLAPEVQAAVRAGHTSCEAGLASQLTHAYPHLTTGRIRKVVPAPANNPRYAFEVRAQPGRWIVVGRYASTWRVVDGGAAAAA